MKFISQYWVGITSTQFIQFFTEKAKKYLNGSLTLKITKSCFDIFLFLFRGIKKQQLENCVIILF